MSWVALLGLCANTLLPVAAGQQSAQFSGETHTTRGQFTGADADLDPLTLAMHEKQLKSLNELRQKRLVADTDKLLQLATELKAEAGKWDKDGPSAKSIKQAEQIEKLAKSVREKMKADL